MPQYAYNPKTEKFARAYGSALRISTKSSTQVCRAITGLNLQKGKGLLSSLLEEKKSLDGKYYTNTTSELLGLLKSAESNAEFKGLDTEKLIIHASAHTGFAFWRPRRFKMRRQRRKVTNIQIVLEQK
ncbi:MAG TPA: uL22 family ribosomal protein [archaeon]|nr:uL22 family ribosomal protein [archaeon]